jgi:deoxyribose-phosphate aldolase
VGYLKAKDYAYVYRDIKALVDLDETITVKVILETCLLSPEEIVTASVIAREVYQPASLCPSF